MSFSIVSVEPKVRRIDLVVHAVKGKTDLDGLFLHAASFDELFESTRCSSTIECIGKWVSHSQVESTVKWLEIWPVWNSNTCVGTVSFGGWCVLSAIFWKSWHNSAAYMWWSSVLQLIGNVSIVERVDVDSRRSEPWRMSEETTDQHVEKEWGNCLRSFHHRSDRRIVRFWLVVRRADCRSIEETLQSTLIAKATKRRLETYQRLTQFRYQHRPRKYSERVRSFRCRF